MFEIRVSAHFDAAHWLRDYGGPCSKIHGHTWTVEAAVAGEGLGRGQLLIDFQDLKALLAEVIAPFDHSCLNEQEPFLEDSPTSENIARFIFGRLRDGLPPLPEGAKLAWVGVSESRDSRVVYREGG